jgi:hypothetical protein
MDACTTAVIAGSATSDGRPILWKNRDADPVNQVVYRDDGKYAYLGIVNAGDAAGLEIWAGINSAGFAIAGFAIMNAASYNLDEEETESEGHFMKVALQSCGSLAEFEALLATTAVGRDVNANFGAIDATGAAAYFETAMTTFVRYDATDPRTAPRGFLVRTNFSESGDPSKGSGVLRARRANALLEALSSAGVLSPERLLADVSRDVANERLGSFPTDAKAPPRFAFVGDSICRQDKDTATESAAVFSGVRPGEDPRLATMWVILGLPAAGAAVPLWVAASGVPAELEVGKEPAPLPAAFDRVRALLFPQRRGDLKKYLDVAALVAPSDGFLAPLLAFEAENFRRAREATERWRVAPPTMSEASDLQSELAKATLGAVEELLARKERPGKVGGQGPPRP